MTNRTHRRHKLIAGLMLVGVSIAPVVLLTQPASAFPKGDPIYQFKYKVIATSHMAKPNLTLSPPPGVFKGGIDLNTGQLLGSITLPDTTFTQNEYGLNITATAEIDPTKPVTGHVNIGTFQVSATSTFNIHILTMYLSSPTLPSLPPLPIIGTISLPPLPVPPVNLVGNQCVTSSPISVTMKGKANLGGASHFNGSFVMPPFENCQAMTSVINQEIPGPGNTFSATATPAPTPAPTKK